MTIAAGFTFDKGVLVCADTEMVSQPASFQGDKIVPISFGGNLDGIRGSKIAFAFAGTVPHARRVIALCQKELTEMYKKRPDEMTVDAMRESIAETIRKFHAKHIFKHPRYGSDQSPSVSLIVGMWSHVSKRTSLLTTYEDMVNEVLDNEFVGIGSYFARYACSNLYRNDMPLKDIVLLAIHVLRQTKNNVPDCGQESQFIVVQNDGIISAIAPYDISLKEVYSEKFVLLINSLLFDLADTDKNIEQIIEKFKTSAIAVRMQGDTAKRGYQSLMRFLAFQAQNQK